MKMKLLSSFFGFVVLVVYSSVSLAILNPDAEVVYLRMDCSGKDDCFTDTSQMVTWIWETRNPAVSANDPLLVKIGVGKFDIPAEPAFCKDRGYVTLSGSGRNQTTLNANGTSLFTGGAALRIINCQNITVQNLTIDGGGVGVWWEGGGNSVWSGVDMSGGNFGWYDFSPGSPDATHYFYGCNIFTNDRSSFPETVAYKVEQSDNWFYGGEIGAFGHSGHSGTAAPDFVAVRIEGGGKFRAFGSAIRAEIRDTPASFSGKEINGIYVGSGLFHMHGGIINVSAENAVNPAQTVKGIKIGAGGTAHTNGTAFNLKGHPEKRAVWRIANNGGTVSSPYQWASGLNPPTFPAQLNPNRGLRSVTGSDTYMETDCDDAGDCSGNSGNPLHPHMMVYDESCSSAGPWFDTVTGQCRQ